MPGFYHGNNPAVNVNVWSGAAAWSPPQSANLIRWLRGNAGVINNSEVAASDGQEVKRWEDQSGNANHCTQATVSKMPTFRASVTAINNQPAVDWDGTDDYLEAADASWPTTTTQTIIIVFQVEVALTGGQVRGIYNRFWTAGTRVDIRESGGSDFISTKIFTTGAAASDLVESDTTEYTDEAKTILAIDRNGANGNMWINGTLVDTETGIGASSYSNPPGVLGAEGANNNNPVDSFNRQLNGIIAELFHYNITLNATDRNSIINEMKTKYNIA